MPVLLEVPGHFEHRAFDVGAVEIERRRADEHRAAAEVLDVEPGVGKDLQVGKHRRILVLVERHRHRREQRLCARFPLPAAELFVEQALVRGVLVDKHQRFAVILQDDVGVERLADHPVYRRRRDRLRCFRRGRRLRYGFFCFRHNNRLRLVLRLHRDVRRNRLRKARGFSRPLRLRLMVENVVDRPADLRQRRLVSARCAVGKAERLRSGRRTAFRLCRARRDRCGLHGRFRRDDCRRALRNVRLHRLFHVVRLIGVRERLLARGEINRFHIPAGGNRRFHAVIHRVEHGALVDEAHLELCRMHVDVHDLGGQLEMQDAGREFPDHD